jgi:hypothetical protein
MSILRRIAPVIGVLLITGLAFVLVEGLSSLIVLGTRAHVLPERRHTRYDAELGWVNIPGLRIPDFYGPNKHLSTNAQGFRGTVDVTPEVPAGQRRVICSGDSFTFGVDLGDQSTWCVKLGSPTIETVNMGQGGYGLDQMYLWYRRDGLSLTHDVHIVAFITEDFRRMAHTVFRAVDNEYGKPRLALRDGAIIITNVPVPRRSYVLPSLRVYFRQLQQLRFMELAGLLGLVGQERPPKDVLPDDAVWTIAARVLADLKAWNEKKGSRLILVYLPRDIDYTTDDADPWRQRVRRWARNHGVTYLDLVASLRLLPGLEIPAMFIRNSPFGRHYTRRGTGWVADQIRPLLRVEGDSTSQTTPPQMTAVRSDLPAATVSRPVGSFTDVVGRPIARPRTIVPLTPTLAGARAARQGRVHSPEEER